MKFAGRIAVALSILAVLWASGSACERPLSPHAEVWASLRRLVPSGRPVVLLFPSEGCPCRYVPFWSALAQDRPEGEKAPAVVCVVADERAALVLKGEGIKAGALLVDPKGKLAKSFGVSQEDRPLAVLLNEVDRPAPPVKRVTLPASSVRQVEEARAMGALVLQERKKR